MSSFNLSIGLLASTLQVATCSAEPAAAAVAEPEAPSTSSSTDPQALLGTWKASGKNLVVDVRESGDGFVGVVSDAPVSRLIGKTMFRDVVFDPARETYSGQVLAVRRKEYVPAVFTVQGDTMTLRAGKDGSSKTMKWHRSDGA
jgi:hypothetical protein